MKEKSQFEKNAAEKQVELLSEALNNAIGASGHWLNATGKGYPRFYPKGVAVSPFNALFMALHSDKTGSKTNLFTLYSEAKHVENPSENTREACHSCFTTGTSM